MITDSHAHLCSERFEADLEAMLERARSAGVTRVVVVGTDVESSRAGRELCARHPGLHWTAGVHPSSSAGADAQVRSQIEALCAQPDCVAVGETGLDYFKQYEPREVQLEAFEWQLELARRLDKPVVIHCRDAHEDTSRMVLEREGLRGVLHCFTMGPKELGPYLEAGLSISFSGVVTYKANAANRAAAREVPLERLLVETDAPWLAPLPQRGQRNEPAFVPEVLACIAAERGMPASELAEITHANSARLFGLRAPAARRP